MHFSFVFWVKHVCCFPFSLIPPKHMIWITKLLWPPALFHFNSTHVVLLKNNLKSVSHACPEGVLNNRCRDRWISYLLLAPQLSPQGPAQSPGSSAYVSRVWKDSTAECPLLARWCYEGTVTEIPPNVRYETSAHSRMSAHSGSPHQKKTCRCGAGRRHKERVG